MKKYILIVFIITAIAQIAVPVQMIVQRETTLRNGELFLFETAPVDPFDAFRGRYVALNFTQGSQTVKDMKFKRGSYIYMTVAADEDRVATLSEPSETKPSGVQCLKVRVRSCWSDKLRLSLPFDRFYMDEYKAKDAEDLYRKRNSRRSGKGSKCYAKVRILNGFAVLEDLIIDGKGIKEILNEEVD